jgi:hypothetical protein
LEKPEGVNQDWTIQRHWQHWAHKTRRQTKQIIKTCNIDVIANVDKIGQSFYQLNTFVACVQFGQFSKRIIIGGTEFVMAKHSIYTFLSTHIVLITTDFPLEIVKDKNDCLWVRIKLWDEAISKFHYAFVFSVYIHKLYIRREMQDIHTNAQA